MAIDPTLRKELESLPKSRQAEVLAYVRSLKTGLRQGRRLKAPRGPLERLAIAAETGDGQAFLEAQKEIDWKSRTAEEIMQAVRWALAAGAYLQARELAALGAKLFPEDTELPKAAYILAAPKAIKTGNPASPSAAADMNWLKKHGDDYRGRWVALRSGELLAAGATLEDLVKQIGSPAQTGILVTRVY